MGCWDVPSIIIRVTLLYLLLRDYCPDIRQIFVNLRKTGTYEDRLRHEKKRRRSCGNLFLIQEGDMT